MNTSPPNVTVRALLWGAGFAALFAALTVYASNAFPNKQGLQLTATQIPVLPYFLLILMVLALNPLCRWIRRARSFSTIELLTIFLMGMVSSGISTFGLTEQLVPIAGSLFNPEWNNRQSEWNRYIAPFVNEGYFVAETGLQRAAQAHHTALTTLLDRKAAQEAARRRQQTRARATAAEAALRAAEATAGAARSLNVSLARVAASNAVQAATEAEGAWTALRGARDLAEPDDVLQTHPALIREDEARVAEAAARLAALETNAFEKVTLFRRGLPPDLRAQPGFFFLPTDDTRSYVARLRRLSRGHTALRAVKTCRQLAVAQPAASPLPATALAPLEAARAALTPLAATNALAADRERLRAATAAHADRCTDLNDQLKQLSEEKRNANREEALALAERIRDLNILLTEANRDAGETKTDWERVNREWAIAVRLQTVLDRLATLQTEAHSGALTAGALKASLTTVLADLAAADISLRRYFIGEVPWSHWVGPLGRWAVLIGLTYVVLMALNVLIFRQWAHNEKLTYPLAELPKALIGEPGATGVPPLFRNGLFWVGFSIAAVVIGWNLFCHTGVVAGLKPFPLDNSWREYLNNTQFHALLKNRCVIFFTMIGLSFLIPKNISFSLWFFHLLFLAQLLLMVWMGFGQDDRSFPSDWLYLHNFRTGEGQGALMVFAGVVMVKCRRYILCAFRPASVADLEPDERQELRWASLAFLLGSGGLILLLWRSLGANLYYTIFCYVVVVVVTIGLVRAVTEGGLLAFQAWAGPFHFIRAFFGLDKAWTSTALFAPLMAYYAMLFMDIKTFIAPAMANALKLREDYRMSRARFHVALGVAIALAAVVAVGSALIFAYARGADTMNSWFYSDLPKVSLFGTICTMQKDAPHAAPTAAGWVVFGGGVMSLLLFARQYVFWLPHPIGLIMLVNPLMDAYWFSILLGWIGNVVVTKYGNQDTYRRARGLFIGLIVGELVIVILAALISAWMGQVIPIDLNRNANPY